MTRHHNISSVLFYLLCSATITLGAEPYVIQIVDAQTKRGIPLVRLATTNGIEYWTDSAGLIAFDEPGLIGGTVHFEIESPGYAYPKDGFGIAGKALETRPGGSTTLELPRTQIAQRLYRLTGQGIYHHSADAGRPTPLKHPNLNGRVMGQDTVMVVPHDGKLHWFWGDTARPGYPLGQFRTSMATSAPATQLDPDLGIDFTYAVDAKGFSRSMFEGDKPGVIWVHGMTEIPDAQGKLRIVGHYARLEKLDKRLEHGICVFNDEKQMFEIAARFPDDAPLHPFGQTLHHTENDVEYVYFCTPYPVSRVRATWADFTNPDRYEAFTPLIAGTRTVDTAKPALEIDAQQNVRHAWKPATAKINAKQYAQWIDRKLIVPDQVPTLTRDRADQQIIHLHTGSVRWNAYRKKWIMIAVREGSPESYLGEVYFTESDHLTGPWSDAVKIATHPKYTYYNPVHHAFLDQQDGRVIHFEGTYTNSFSGNPHRTPRYDYNQLMYRLDLADPRLAAP